MTEKIFWNSPLQQVSHFNSISEHLKHINRFSLHPIHEEFVIRLLKFSNENCKKELEVGTKLFRARINKGISRGSTYKNVEMGPPNPRLSSSGRMNPEGISYLYCADNLETAICEIRPHIGAEVTVSSVTLIKQMSFVDLTCGAPQPYENFWTEIFATRFSEPIDPEEKLDYVVPQFFAERFKGYGFEGIIWKSGQSDGGNNVVLFDSSLCTIVVSGMKIVKSASYLFM